MGKGLWGLIMGEDDYHDLLERNPIDAQKQAYKDWMPRSKKVLHWISYIHFRLTTIRFKALDNKKTTTTLVYNMITMTTRKQNNFNHQVGLEHNQLYNNKSYMSKLYCYLS